MAIKWLLARHLSVAMMQQNLAENLMIFQPYEKAIKKCVLVLLVHSTEVSLKSSVQVVRRSASDQYDFIWL